MDIFTHIIFLSVGFLIGVTDAVAGGGNLFILGLLSLVGLSPIHAIATMQVISFSQTLSSTAVFAKEKLINWKQVSIFAAPAIFGSFIGARFVLGVDEELLSKSIGYLMLFVLLFIPFLRKRKVTFVAKIINTFWDKIYKKGPAITHDKLNLLALFLFTFFIGVYGGFYGAAVGTFLLLGFFFLGEANILVTAATTKGINLLLTLAASYVFLNVGGLVIWKVGIPLIIGSVIGSFFGVKWAEAYGYLYVRMLLYTVTVLASIRLVLFS